MRCRHHRLLHEHKILFIVAVYLGFFFFSGIAFAEDTNDLDRYLLKTPQTIPDGKLMEQSISFIQQYKYNPAMGRDGNVGGNIVEIATGKTSTSKAIGMLNDDIFKGMHNGFYSNTFELPLTKFIFGNVTVDSRQIFIMARAWKEFWSSSGNDKSDWETYAETLITQTESSTYDSINALIENAKQTIGTLFMRTIPLIMLFLVFTMQLFGKLYMITISSNKNNSESFEWYNILVRLFIYTIVILFFKPVALFIIDFSSLAANALVGIKEQEAIISQLILKFTSFNLADNGTFSSILNYFFRMLAYISLKILLIVRDVLLALTIVTGPIVFSLAFFHGQNGESPLGYMHGWIQSFVKLLMWGIISGIMILSLGLMVVMNNSDMVSTFATAVTGLAFLYAAMNVPHLSEKMSALAIQSVLTGVGGVALAGGTTFVGSTWASGKSFSRWVYGVMTNEKSTTVPPNQGPPSSPTA